MLCHHRVEYHDCAAMGECCDRTGGTLHYLTGDMKQRDNAHRLIDGKEDGRIEVPNCTPVLIKAYHTQ